MVAFRGHSFDAAHWRNCAEEARAVAEFITNPVSRLNMLEIALSYDHMAERAEAHAETKAAIGDKKSA